MRLICMIPEIWRTTDWTFCHLGPFFALLPPAPPPKQPKKKTKIEKMKKKKKKKTPGDIVILQKWTIHDNHMMYGFWDMEWNWQIFCRFRSFFVLLPIKNLQNQNFEKMNKKPGAIIILQMCTTNDNHMMYGSWDMECNGQNLLSFWNVFCSFIPLTQEIKILKKLK